MKHTFHAKYATFERFATTLLAEIVFVSIAALALILVGCHARAIRASIDAGADGSIVDVSTSVDDAGVRTTEISHAAPLAGRMGLGGTLPDGGGNAPVNVTGDNLQYFGSGADGVLSVDGGAFTMSRDMYWSSLGGSGTLVTANFRVFVSGTLDLTTGLVITDGTAGVGGAGAVGGNASFSAGGAGGTAVAYGTLPQGTPGSAGGAGYTGSADAGSPAANAAANGGGSTVAGAGGASVSSAGGPAGAAGTALAFPFYTWTASPIIGFLQGGQNGIGNAGVAVVPIPYGGIGGAGGGGGSGTIIAGTIGSGGGGGGGGGSGGTVWICAAIINRTNAGTVTGAITSNGAAGGAGGAQLSSYPVNGSGGGGGGSGGGGGPIYIYYAQLTGNIAFNAIVTNGGNGGGGGAIITTTGGAVAGSGGGGGGSGSVTIGNLLTPSLSFTAVVAGAAGTAGSGATPGTGGTAGLLTVAL